eukprot:g5182.t1
MHADSINLDTPGMKKLKEHMLQFADKNDICSNLAHRPENSDTAMHALMEWTGKNLHGVKLDTGALSSVETQVIDKLDFLSSMIGLCTEDDRKMFIDHTNQAGQKAFHALALISPPSSFLTTLLGLVGAQKSKDMLLENFGKFRKQTLLHSFAASRDYLVTEVAAFVDARSDSEDLRKLLLTAKEGIRGGTPLHVAAERGSKHKDIGDRGKPHVEVFGMLEKFEDEDSRKTVLMTTDNDGGTCLLSAMRGQNVGAVQRILANAKPFVEELISKQSAHGRTALHEATFYRFDLGINEVKSAIGNEMFAKLSLMQDKDGNTYDNSIVYAEPDFQIYVASHDEISAEQYRGLDVDCMTTMDSYVKCLMSTQPHVDGHPQEESPGPVQLTRFVAEMPPAPLFKSAYRRWRKWQSERGEGDKNMFVLFIDNEGSGEDEALQQKAEEAFDAEWEKALDYVKTMVAEETQPKRLRVIFGAHGNSESNSITFDKTYDYSLDYDADDIKLMLQNLPPEEKVHLSVVIASCESGLGPFCDNLAKLLVTSERKSTTVTCNLASVFTSKDDGRGLEKVRLVSSPFKDEETVKRKYSWGDNEEIAIEHIPV